MAVTRSNEEGWAKSGITVWTRVWAGGERGGCNDGATNVWRKLRAGKVAIDTGGV